jgi:glutamine phosphoribosylpyrophosphate amidotransferase
MITCGPKGRFYQCKANGMVRDVFDANAIARLVGGMGVGHGMSAKTPFSQFLYLFSVLLQCATLQQEAF